MTSDLKGLGAKRGIISLIYLRRKNGGSQRLSFQAKYEGTKKKKKERVGKDKRIGKEKDKQIKENFTTDQE